MIWIQKLWKTKIGWDEKLPDDIIEKWNEFWTDIMNWERVKIDRWIGTDGSVEIQMHECADSSTAAFGAQIYADVIHRNGNGIDSRRDVSKTIS